MHDESYIQIAIELAKKGNGFVSPKPLVGALVVKNDKIIGASFKNSPEDECASVCAIKNSKGSVENSILYTNIEPTLFCEEEKAYIDYIINSKIKKVVIGCVNPHREFGGIVIEALKKDGIEVQTGILEKECTELNKFYFKYCHYSQPFITLKMASTIDGKIADTRGKSKWITSVESRSKVHELRNNYDAVLVGIRTVQFDNPGLTVRLVEGRNPKRIVMDANLQLSIDSYLVKNNSDKNLIVITSKKNKTKKRKLDKLFEKEVEVIFAPENKDGKLYLANSMKKLGKRNITSVLVEGGGRLFSGFIKEKLDDEILIFIGPKILGEGIPLTRNIGIKSLAKAAGYFLKDLEKIGEDALLTFVRR